MKRLLILFLAVGVMVAVLAKVYLIGPGVVMRWQGTEEAKLPYMKGINLVGEDVVFPRDLTASATLMVLAFKRKQQKEVDTWIKAHEKSGWKSSVGFYEIPIIYEAGVMQRLVINNGMRMGIPDAEQLLRTVTVYMDRERIFQALKMEEDSIYTFLVAQDGRILWRQKGVATAEALAGLEKVLQPLLKTEGKSAP